MLFYGSGVNKLNSSIFILCPRWVETDFCRDETRREIFGTRRDRIQDKVSLKDAFKTSRDRTRQKSWVSRQDKTYGFFKISRRDGTRQHFPSRPGREIETRNFPTHHWGEGESENQRSPCCEAFYKTEKWTWVSFLFGIPNESRVGRSQVEHSKFTWNMLHSTAILPAFLDKETSLISKPHHYVDVHQKIGVRLWGTEVPKHWTNMGKKLCQMAKECPTKVVWDRRSMKNFKFIKFNSVVSPPAGEM